MECTNTTGSAVFIVSDKFKEFSKNNGVFTHSDFLRAAQDSDPSLSDVSTIIVGQGLDETRVDELRGILENHPVLGAVRLCAPSNDRVDTNLVHKETSDNVMISSPERVGLQEYFARLNISDRCAEMSDHVTGHHVQGAVLIEAARQMMMASVERYVIHSDEHGLYSYVLNDLAIKFYQYLFPLTAEIHLVIDRFERDEKGQLSIELTTNISQGDEVVCSVKCKSSGYPKSKLAVLEARKSQQFVRAERNKWSAGTAALNEREERPAALA